MSGPGQELQDVSKDEGIRTVTVEMARQPSPMKDLMSLWRLIRFLERSDLILCIVVIHGKDGRIRSKHSYGNDPFPPHG